MSTEANTPQPEGSEKSFDPEEHRALVRELSRAMGMAYGLGGGGVLLLIGAIVAGAWWMGAIWSPIPWILAVVAALIGLMVVRMVVYRRADQLYARLESYCRANTIEMQVLREHYDESLFPYFEAIFEVKQRRQRIEDDR